MLPFEEDELESDEEEEEVEENESEREMLLHIQGHMLHFYAVAMVGL